MPFNKYAHVIPFLSLITQKPPDIPNRPMLTRLIEQGVVGIVAAFIAIYVNDIRQEEQLKTLKESIGVARMDMREMEGRLMAALDREHADRIHRENILQPRHQDDEPSTR